MAVKLSEIFTKQNFTTDGGFSLPYRMYIPKNYDCGEYYPLLVVLHGAGERGTDNEVQISCNIDGLFGFDYSPAWNSIVIVPQCPEDSQWVETPWEDGNYRISEVPESVPLRAVVDLIKELRENYNIDDRRIYVTGLSMGGFGTWDLLARHGGLFAAGMPVCGGGDPTKSRILSEIPIRTFHGLLDTTVPTEGTREMYAAISAEGKGRIYYKEYEDVGHDAWNRAYGDINNQNWLFSKKKPIHRERTFEINLSRKTLKKAGIVAGAIGLIALITRKKK